MWDSLKTGVSEAETDAEVVEMKTDHCSRSLVVNIRRKRNCSLKGHFASMGSVLFLNHRCDLFVKFQRPVNLCVQFHAHKLYLNKDY